MVVKQHVAILKGRFFATDSSEVQQKSDALLMPVIISEKSRKFESRQRTILGKVSDKTGFLWPTLCSWLFVLQIEDKFDFCLSAMTPNIFRSAGSQCHLIQEDQEWKNIWKELGSNLGRAIPQVYGTTIIWQIFLSHQTVARRRTFDWPRRKLKHLHRNDHFVFSLNDVLFLWLSHLLVLMYYDEELFTYKSVLNIVCHSCI